MAERSHDLQTHRLMDDWVEFWHGGDPGGLLPKIADVKAGRDQRPPPNTAIHHQKMPVKQNRPTRIRAVMTRPSQSR